MPRNQCSDIHSPKVNRLLFGGSYSSRSDALRSIDERLAMLKEDREDLSERISRANLEHDLYLQVRDSLNKYTDEDFIVTQMAYHDEVLYPLV